MQRSLSEEVSRLLNDNMITDIRAKFGYGVPKDMLEPLLVRANNTIFGALEQIGEPMVYVLVDHYEEEFENVVQDVMGITGETEEKVRRKINEAVDNLGNSLYRYIQTWRRVERSNTAHVAAQPPRKTPHVSRQARNKPGRHFTR